MDSHPGCGVCGPKLHALDEKDGRWERTDRFEYAGAAGGRIDLFGYPFCRGRVMSRAETDRGQYDSPSGILWISGACLMTRASLWRRLGGLDERFFAHMEEIDYCWRAQRLGFGVALVPQSTVGAIKARGIIWARLMLDTASAFVYLLQGKPAAFSAVFRAHKGYRRLRKSAGPQAEGSAKVAGYWKKCIILQCLLRGDGIFEYLKRYEDSH